MLPKVFYRIDLALDLVSRKVGFSLKYSFQTSRRYRAYDRLKVKYSCLSAGIAVSLARGFTGVEWSRTSSCGDGNGLRSMQILWPLRDLIGCSRETLRCIRLY